MTKEEIKALRQRLGLTQDELAVKLGVHTRSVSRWERGIASPLPVIRKQLETIAKRAEKGTQR